MSMQNTFMMAHLTQINDFWDKLQPTLDTQTTALKGREQGLISKVVQ